MSSQGDAHVTPPAEHPDLSPGGSIGTGADSSPAVQETHTAVLVFLGDRVYKMKKAVELGFVDFSSREARARACDAEVELNRRFAPDVYLGALDVVDDAGAPCERIAVMRRMPKERRLSTLAAKGDDVGRWIDEVADVIAQVHGQSDRLGKADARCTVDDFLELWRSNLDPLSADVVELGHKAVDHCAELSTRYLEGRRRLFEQRIEKGYIRDGHGDLLADDIFCLDDGPRILDCLDFDPSLRRGDVLADVAFLAMDLERLHRPDMARRLLDRYRHLSGGTWPASLEHHYIAYRAGIRAKVAAIRSHQMPEGADKAAQTKLCGEYLHLALRHLHAAQPRIVLVGGLPATGKSTVAAQLEGAELGLWMRTDEIRNDLALPEDVRYSDAGRDAVYDEMLQRAQQQLALGESVVLDATWQFESHRQAARRLAEVAGASIVELRCECPSDLAATRMEKRQKEGTDPSEVTSEAARHITSSFDPWPEAVSLDTSGWLPAVIRAATRHIADANPPKQIDTNATTNPTGAT